MVDTATESDAVFLDRKVEGLPDEVGKKVTMDWESFFTNYRKPGFIPGFEIVNKLGVGVFGEVYKARKESIGKFYAIKFLKVSDEKISEAIVKELDSLRYFAQLDHPNLVTIEDQGEVCGIPFIVMGYAGDETLKKRMSKGAMSNPDVDAFFRQICAGVAALHEKSIIHFDLKPANIFINGDHARVGDYGLSKLVSESHNTMSIGRGTPYYMAPEMLRRRGDYKSDIYSLGVILFEMLTGDVPFKGDSEWEVLKKHEEQAVVVPATVPAPMRSVIERAMAKRPEERFPSVADMLAHLDGATPVAPRRAMSGPSAPLRVPPRVARSGPPPLPTASTLATTREDVRRNLQKVARHVKKIGGEAAENARRIYEEKRRGAGKRQEANFDSFYSDLENQDPEPVTGATHDEILDDETPLPKRGGGIGAVLAFPFKLVWWVLWPVRALLKGVGGLLKMAWKGVGIFFQNFLRYSIILALTVGLAFLIHFVMRGF